MDTSDIDGDDSPRAQQRLQWARQALDDPQLELAPASSDASFRSYWRTTGSGAPRIIMDAPPDREDLGPWIDIAGRLCRAGLNAPRVLAENRELGFLALTDLGRELMLPALDSTRVDALYDDATSALLTMQQRVDCDQLPRYDEPRLVAEMELMPTWFLQRHLSIDIACEQWDVIEVAFRALITSAQAQPQRFVHRDFHSRNLMLTDGQLGIIDFQDAVLGPISYDLVSLLRDCYITWPPERVDGWVERYRLQAVDAGITSADAATFRRWFDLMGLQRHIKVLGIFCRLWYRDGKSGYLGDLPRVWRYVQEVGREYPDIAPMIALLEQSIGDRDLTRPLP